MKIFDSIVGLHSRIMLRFQKIILFFLLFQPIVFGAVANTPVSPTETDSFQKTIRIFDYSKSTSFDAIPKEKLLLRDTASTEKSRQLKEKYNSSAFDYSDQANDRLSFWDRVSRWIEDFLASINPHWNGDVVTVLYYLFIGIGVILVLYIIYRLIAGRTVRWQKKEIEKAQNEWNFVEKNLLTLNLDSYIEKAIQEKQWNVAVRYLHLRNLQLLAIKQHIHWDYRKTNLDFLQEIKSEEIRKEFTKTNQLFNYIWFGNFQLTMELYQEFQRDFIHFNHTIQ